MSLLGRCGPKIHKFHSVCSKTRSCLFSINLEEAAESDFISASSVILGRNHTLLGSVVQ